MSMKLPALLSGCLAIGCSGATHVPDSPGAETYTSASTACAAEPIRATGVKHYFCDCKAGADSGCQVGSEANDGLSVANPKQLFTTAVTVFQSMAAGDTVLFCKGGAFDAANEGRWVNPNCRANNTCDVRDYVDTRNGHTDPGEKPVIKAISGDTNQVAVLNFDDGSFNHEEGYRFLNLDFEHGADSVGRGVLLVKDITDVFMCNNTFNAFTTPVQNQATCSSGCPNTIASNDRFTMRGNLITNNGGSVLLASNFATIEYNYFDHNGDGAALSHPFYLQGFDWLGVTQVNKGEIVRGNQFYHSNQGGKSPGRCNATIVDAHGRRDNLTIEGNIVAEEPGTANGGCWGLALDNGYNSIEGFTNLVVKNNRIIDVGNVGIGTMMCVNCTIENNLIVQDSAVIGGSTIIVPDKNRSGTNASSFVTTGMTIRNNTIYWALGSGTGISLNSDGVIGTNNVITNNAIMVNGTSAPFGCFSLNMPASSYSAMDYNDCYFPNLAAAKWELNSGNSLAAWRTFSGLDAHSFTSNPLFTNPAAPTYDFTTQAASPLRSAGDPAAGTFSIEDIAGKARPSPPDIGAFQH